MAHSLSLLAAVGLTVAIAAQEPTDWWAWRPLQRPAVPAVADAGWAANDLDRFVLAGLEAAGLQPSASADKRTLLRRATLDLTGLLPTGAETEAFLADTAPDAFDKVIERLLASPQYGVKWARHWLDVVRFAETDGYERDRQKPFIWRYRDWVVDAFNGDLPWGRFLHAQLAGDELPAPTVGDLVATGYYRLGIWDDEPTDPEQARYDDLDGIADTTARAMLGISMGCARCHDHKRDPIPTRDYYSFLSFFENIRPTDHQAKAVPADGAVERHANEVSAFATARQQIVARLRGAAANAWGQLSAARRVSIGAQADAGVVARYTADRDNPKTLHDTIGERHGAVHGQVVSVAGKSGLAMRFDGDDRVELPRLVEGSFTVSFQVRSDHRGRGHAGDTRWFSGDGLVDGEVSGAVADWGVAWHSDGRVVAGTGDPETFLASPPGFHDGRWHHVAFTRDQSTGRIALYVDGEPMGEAEGGKQLLSAPPKLVLGGLQPGGHGFRGDLDEVAFHDRALSADEVAALALELPGGVHAPAVLGAAPADADGRSALSAFGDLRALKRPRLDTVQILAVAEQGREAPDGFVRVRGNVHAKGPQVAPGFPAILRPPAPQIEAVRPGLQSSGRRTALAKWITAPDNPLTWRVLANRLWQHHFGRGLVRSSNDFGKLGDQPTHPELLDWLAVELLQRGQSLKSMHRLILSSKAWQMASSPVPAAAAIDPRNDRFWRFDRRRMTAEELRDAILQVDGSLSLQLGGPSVFPPLPAEVLATSSRPEDAWGHSTPEQAARRSLYVHVKRSLQEPVLAVFDQADTDNSCPVRFATVQPTQALILMNGDFAQARARAFAERLLREAPDLPARIRLGLRLCWQREATAEEVARYETLVTGLREFGRDEAAALQRCCLIWINTNEFAFVD
ncbi:MAG: DUF1553 domain-containing protein [Planctomycetes bacterium]|nr:DUF1553 domain-containing protein [Planctomycetota bacterium]